MILSIFTPTSSFDSWQTPHVAVAYHIRGAKGGVFMLGYLSQRMTVLYRRYYLWKALLIIVCLLL